MAENDVFHVVGFTGENILQGTGMQVTGLGIVAMKRNQELWQQVGPLQAALQSGKVTLTPLEVYGISPFLYDDLDKVFPAISNLLGEKFYQSVEFLNDEAMNLCNEIGIKLPPVLGKLTRAALPPPPQIEIVCRAPVYKRAAAART